MIEYLLDGFDHENSYLHKDRHIFHEDLIYYAFNCGSLTELRILNKELIAEGIIEPIICNFYITTEKIKKV